MTGLINWLRVERPNYRLKVNKRDQDVEIEMWADLFGFKDDVDDMAIFAEDHKDEWISVTLDLNINDQEVLYNSMLANVNATNENGVSWFNFASDKNILPDKEIDDMIKHTKYEDDTYKPWFGGIFTNNRNDATFYALIDRDGDIRILYTAEIILDIDPITKLKDWIEG